MESNATDKPVPRQITCPIVGWAVDLARDATRRDPIRRGRGFHFISRQDRLRRGDSAAECSSSTQRRRSNSACASFFRRSNSLSSCRPADHAPLPKTSARRSEDSDPAPAYLWFGPGKQFVDSRPRRFELRLTRRPPFHPSVGDPKTLTLRIALGVTARLGYHHG